MRNATILLLAALLTAGSVSAQTTGWTRSYGSILDDPAASALGSRALTHLYDMERPAARAAIDSLKAFYPGHPAGPFLDGLVIWWDILPNLNAGDRSLDNAFFQAMDQTVKAADEMKSGGPHAWDALFFKAAALGFRGRHLSNRKEWLRAASDGKEALDLVFEIAEQDSSNPDFQFGTGVYNYFAAVIPEEYPLVKPFMFFFPAAEKEKGIETLEHVAQEATFVGTEAAYFLLQIYLVYEPDFAGAVRMVESLRVRHPSNSFFHVLEGRVFARWGRWGRTTDVFEHVLRLHQEGAPGYSDGIAQSALYYLGRSRLAAGHLRPAVEILHQLEELAANDPNSVYRAIGRLRAGMALDRLGEREEAIAAYRLVLELPEVSDSHDRARQYLKRPFGS